MDLYSYVKTALHFFKPMNFNYVYLDNISMGDT